MGRESERKPPVRILELRDLPDEHQIARLRIAFVGAQGLYLALMMAGTIHGIVRGEVAVPVYAHIFNVVYLGLFGILLWLTLRRILWAIYVRASLGALLAVLSVSGVIVASLLAVSDLAVRFAYELIPGILNALVAVLGFKYGSLLNLDQAVRNAREMASSQGE